MNNPPCKGCQKRTIPKQCEKDCELWQKYVKEKHEDSVKIKKGKSLHKRIEQTIWRNGRCH